MLGMSSQPLWVGQYHTSSGKPQWQHNCEYPSTLGSSYRVISEDTECYAWVQSNTYRGENCRGTELPFICQASVLEDTCFTTQSTVYSADRVSGPDFSCEEKFRACSEKRCLGFDSRDSGCTLLTFTDDKNYQKGTNFAKALLNTAIFELSGGGSNTDIADICQDKAILVSSTDSYIRTTSEPTSTKLATSHLTTASQRTPTQSSVTSETLFSSGILDPSFATEMSNSDLQSSRTPPLTEQLSSLKTDSLHSDVLSNSLQTACLVKTMTMKQSDIENQRRQLKEELLLKRKKLSSYQRKLISAPDERRSAKVIGGFGVVIICLVPGIIFLLDLGKLVSLSSIV